MHSLETHLFLLWTIISLPARDLCILLFNKPATTHGRFWVCNDNCRPLISLAMCGREDFLPRAHRTKLWTKHTAVLTPRPRKGEEPSCPKHLTRKCQPFGTVLSLPVEKLCWGSFTLQWCQGDWKLPQTGSRGVVFPGMGIGMVLEETVVYHLLPPLVQRRGKGQEWHAPLLAAWFTADQYKLLPVKHLYC